MLFVIAIGSYRLKRHSRTTLHLAVIGVVANVIVANFHNVLLIGGHVERKKGVIASTVLYFRHKHGPGATHEATMGQHGSIERLAHTAMVLIQVIAGAHSPGQKPRDERVHDWVGSGNFTLPKLNCYRGND